LDRAASLGLTAAARTSRCNGSACTHHGTSGILYLSVTPIFILLLAARSARAHPPRAMGRRPDLVRGVALIATQGNVHLVSFNIGDLMAVASMLMWAGYTVLLRVRRDPLDIAELLTMVCGFGSSTCFPGWHGKSRLMTCG